MEYKEKEIYDDYNDFCDNHSLDNEFILYHGGADIITSPDVYHNERKTLDFGEGFYTTTFHNQAEDMANAKVKHTWGVVSVYSYDGDADENDFGMDYSKEWLEFIKECRQNGRQYDNGEVIIGRVADDKRWKLIRKYVDNEIGTEEMLDILYEAERQYDLQDDQYCFTTNRVIKRTLTFLGAYYAKE